MYRKILVPIEAGALEKGERIFRKAASLLDAGGEIILLNVVEMAPSYIMVDFPPDLLEDAVKDARARLEELKTKTGIAARIQIRKGPPAREILETAKELGADLIVIASHTPDFSNYFIGATADRVVRHSLCSVLVDR